MSAGDYELLETTGFSFTEMSVAVPVLTANYGSGYGDGATVGLPLMGWTVEITVLPDLEEYSIYEHDLEGETRANYLWELFLRSKLAGNRPFRFIEPKDGKEYFAEFVEHKLTYQMFTAKVFSTGLELRQRRVTDYESPGETTGNPDII